MKKKKIIIGLVIVVIIITVCYKSLDYQWNSPNENTPTETLTDIIDQYDSSEKLLTFLNNNFTAEIEGNSLSSAEVFQQKRGNLQDLVRFFAYVLNYHDYESAVLCYKSSATDSGTTALAVFREGDVPKYLYFDLDEFYISEFGWTFEELLQKEEERLGIEILEYTVFHPKDEDGEWRKR